jgi:hypothetical protein
VLVYAEILVLRGEFIKSRFEMSAALGQIGSAFVVLSQARRGGDERPEWFLRNGNVSCGENGKSGSYEWAGICERVGVVSVMAI